MRKENEVQKRKTGKFKLKMTFAILVLAALSIVEVYLMMNYQTEYLYLGAVGLMILCFIYWIVDISFRMQAEDDAVHEKEYENLYKAEKVSYISMKQGFMDIAHILKKMEDLPVDDVIQSQKAIGKVTIQRNKESMQAIMDAQKELKERMDALESRLSEVGGISERQQEILDAIQRLESDVREYIAGGTVSAPAVKDVQTTQDADLMNEVEKSSEEASAGAMMTDEQIADLLAAQDQAAEEEKSGTDEVVEETKQESSAGAMMTDEQIAELLAAQDQAAGEGAEENADESIKEAQSEEASAGAMMTDEQIAELLAAQDQAAGEEIEENTGELIEETPLESDAGTMMTEEEIEQLLSFQETSAAETPAAEENAEEKPAMPDLSDPSHVMTPEEIAALLANM